ncbi:MAG: hypothetical protein VW268_03555 [Rhodospirillaceae bacterium]
MGPKFWRAGYNRVDEGPDLDAFVGARLRRALSGGEIERVTVRFVDNSRDAPRENCSQRLHGGWETLLRMPSRQR